MLRVGLTGGAGAGKSTVAARLGERGAVVIDADQLAREVVEPGTPGFAAVVDEFGDGIVAPDGGLDRPALARVVFADEQRRQALNAIVHPLVRERRGELVAAAPADAVVVEDIPLLVENDLAPTYPLVIVVHAPDDVREQRLVRRGLAAADARARIRAQATDAQRWAAADVWLKNDAALADLVARVDALWHERLVPFEANCRHQRPAPRSPQPMLTGPDPDWPAQAARTARRVARIAGDRAHRIDHIGSTSVPGLPAKDVLDLQVVVDDLDSAGSLADELTEVGLVRLPGRWTDALRDGSERDKAVAGNADPLRAVNLHIRPVSSPAWTDAVLLRDWLRATPDGVAEYAALKRELATGRYASMDDYARQKTPWISEALARADAWAEATG